MSTNRYPLHLAFFSCQIAQITSALALMQFFGTCAMANQDESTLDLHQRERLDEIKDRAAALHLTLGQLCGKANIDDAVVGRWDNNKVSPQSKVFRIKMRALEATLAELEDAAFDALRERVEARRAEQGAAV